MLQFLLSFATTPALVGLVLQKAPFAEVVSGVFKTALGLLILLAGCDLISEYLQPFTSLLSPSSIWRGCCRWILPPWGCCSSRAPSSRASACW